MKAHGKNARSLCDPSEYKIATTSVSTLYAHIETTTIGGVDYYLYKQFVADGNGTTLSASAATTGF